MHEIGHLLGIGIGDRWHAGEEGDSVIVDGTARYFYVQTDSVAIRRYEDWVTWGILFLFAGIRAIRRPVATEPESGAAEANETERPD